jgi:DNA-binding winged helix-turn-helix (wHTH) protein
MSFPMSAIAEREPNGGGAALAFPARYARFGTFEVDLEREELYQNGQRVKVQSKLFQALLLLVSRAGDVVTREEVRRHLWPDAFLTNLDANVNTTMNKLRQVLADSPEAPTYIETIPRRGYTFIAGVVYSSTREELAERANIESAAAVRTDAPRLWSDARISIFARALTLLVAGMIVGALLAFAWASSQRTNSQHAANPAKASAALFARESQHVRA